MSLCVRAIRIMELLGVAKVPWHSHLHLNHVDNKLFKLLNFNFHALNLLFFFFHFFRLLLRELQRIESISSAPVISHFSETILGLTTIRAYNQESRFMEMLFERMEANNVAFVILNSSNRWLGIALVREISLMWRGKLFLWNF